ncbi:MAG: ROK family protein [Firmicutes bacterium]|nr:ROK family protein [Bacillota bacterium]
MYYIGIDLGGTNIAAGLVDSCGRLLRKSSIPTQKERHYREILTDMALLARGLVEEAGLSLAAIQSIGVGAPGTPDVKNGVLIYNNNLGFKNVPVRTEIQKHLPLPVHLDNDANCAALAEGLVGAAKGASSSVTITLGTGIGSGVIINHQVYSGFNYAAAELGHMVIKFDGQVCTCGRRGCWEAYASATALIRQARAAAAAHPESLLLTLAEGDPANITAKTPFDAARQGDPFAASVVEQYFDYLAVGVSNIINIFQPEVIVLGGGIAQQGESLLSALQKRVAREIYTKDSEAMPATQLKEAVLGNDAGIVGAALLGFTTE